MAQVLGIKRNADDTEIKKAFRKCVWTRGFSSFGTPPRLRCFPCLDELAVMQHHAWSATLY